VLTAPFLLLLELPPLAFGPSLPPSPFNMPRELTCPVAELGRLQAAPAYPPPALPSGFTDIPAWKPVKDRHLVNSAVDFALVMGALATSHGGWDDRPTATRIWQNSGGMTPVIMPPAWLRP
jgi:hypothetical protein